MQTFLPNPNFTLSARILDNKRLGKQRVEAKQIMEINLAIQNPTLWGIDYSNKKLFKYGNGYELGYDSVTGFYGHSTVKYYREKNKIPWENHPAVRMWRGYEIALAYYGATMCREWIKRGFKDTILDFFVHKYPPLMPDSSGVLGISQEYYPEWMKNIQVVYDFCYSHRANLMRKDPVFYGKYNWEFFGDYNVEPYKWNKEYWK
jgi:hypothetical protein